MTTPTTAMTMPWPTRPWTLSSRAMIAPAPAIWAIM
jgi:hypothetical protein